MLDAIVHFLHSLYNPEGLKELIRSGGAPLICGIVFIETGFFVGFFLPGDSLLVTAGIFSAHTCAPTRLALQIWFKSVERPSEVSIIEETYR